MATTSSSGLRYPISSDSPNIAQYFQNLATDVDQKVILTVASPTERGALTGTYAHQLVREASTSRIYRRNSANSAWEYAGGAPPPIVAVSFFGGWSSLSGHTPGVYKDASGLVKIVGVATNGAAYNPQDGTPHTIFTLPTGYRPAVTFQCPITTGGATGAVVYIQVGTSGVVEVSGGLTSSIGVGFAHYFQGIPAFHPTYAGTVPLS